MHVELCYCKYCVDQLEEWGEPAKTVFETICEWYVIQRYAMIVFSYELNILQVVEFLEQHEFVVTTDIDEGDIAVVPAACEPVDGVWMICADNSAHGHVIKMPGSDD